MNSKVDDLMGRLVAKVWDQWQAEHQRVCGVWPHDETHKGVCPLPPPSVLADVKEWREASS